MGKIRNHPRYYNVFVSGSLQNPQLYTKNLTVGNQIYGEKLITENGIEYRTWNPHQSKLAAILINNPETHLLRKGLKCLYLGAASGTTVSHLSDILINGIIYSVEFAERSMRQFIQNTSERENIIPILGDARYPVEFAKSVFTNIDLLYQDVAQPNQAEIALKNSQYYLSDDGILILLIKSQSIDSVKKSKKVYSQEKRILKEGGLEIVETINIHNYASNHLALIAKKI
ncbi:MAG: fibrillarin-like rRNA/tRNA 2'-O-methyltransferase [Promethearchaeota archaeon]|nr:MAG: fibrillarin-like rRNA/tRNA 2'-O-methyltransferase [Candidatus Lokiarchaeota archaeon]